MSDFYKMTPHVDEQQDSMLAVLGGGSPTGRLPSEHRPPLHELPRLHCQPAPELVVLAQLDELAAARRAVDESELPEHSAGTKADEQAIKRGLQWLDTLINSPAVQWAPGQKWAATDDLRSAREGLRHLLYGDPQENAPNGH